MVCVLNDRKQKAFLKKVAKDLYSMSKEGKSFNLKDYITSIYKEKEGVYWLGTFGSGIIKWNENTQEKEVFNKTDGLPNNVIYGVLNNEKKELWMSTNKGISCMNLKTHTFVNYKEVNGLMSNEFNMGSFFKSKNGEFYFGGISGYNYFEPKNLHIKHKELKVQFTHLKIDKDWIKASDKGSPLTTTISKTKRLELSYKQRRNLIFQFFASDLSNPNLINYKYVIEGLDEGETFLGNKNEIILQAILCIVEKFVFLDKIGKKLHVYLFKNHFCKKTS